jgi:DNA-binding CsgD family transcriptional regulator
MPADPQVAEVMEIAASTVPLLERAQGLMERLDRWLPVEATWLALSDPESNVYATVGSTGLDRSVLDFLDRPAVAQEIQLTEINRMRPPVSLAELPIAADELPTWAECLLPAGFREGLGVPLVEPGGPYLGMLTLLFSRRETPTASLRDRLTELSPLIARGVSPMRSLLTTARIVQGAKAGAVLHRDGTTYTLGGLDGHALLAADSPVVAIARASLLAGQVYRSFMWPEHDDPGTAGHARVAVPGATDVPAFVLGTLLLIPEVHSRGLTPRELEVLGLLIEGRSNQQIARHLAITARTVAAHMEHILGKLEVLTRTQAAVRAEREGCYVPPSPPRRAPTLAAPALSAV